MAKKAVSTVPAFMEQQPRLGPVGAFSFPRARSMRLDSGLRLLLMEKHDLPLVYLRVTIPAGTTQDPEGGVGTAYITGRMLAEGAGSRSALAFSTALSNIGATLSAWVNKDATFISLKVLREHLDSGLDLLADALLRPRFTARDLARVKGELKARALQRRSQPTHVAHLALWSALFGEHPYGRPLLPLPRQIGAVKRERLRAWHQAHYRPAGAIVAAAGDITAKELKEKLDARLAGWRGAVPPQPSQRAPSRGPRLVLVDRPGAAQSVLLVGHPAPARKTPDRVGLRILNTLLGGSFTSRLNQNLRERHGFTYGISSSFSLMVQGGVFSVQTSVESQHTVAALKEIFNELQGVFKRPPTKRELTKARRLMVESLPGQAETVRGLVDAFSDLALHHLPLNTLARLPGAVAAQTPQSVLQHAERRLHPGRATIVVVGDMTKLAASLEEIYGEAQIRDLDGLILQQER